MALIVQKYGGTSVGDAARIKNVARRVGESRARGDQIVVVVSAMGNVMLAPHIGPVRPYVLTGLGLMKTHVDLSPSNLLSTGHNGLAWDTGGGLMVNVAPHVAVRGDVRYFHAFSDLTVGPLALQNVKLDFGRAAGGLVLSF